MSTTSRVAVIDAGGWFSTDQPSSSLPPADLVRQVREACQTVGFFQLVNHGVDPALQSRVWDVTHKFFDLPLQEKLKIKRSPENARGFFNDELTKQTLDLKECFDFGYVPYPELPEDHPQNVSKVEGFNRWPEGQEEFKHILKLWYATCERVAFQLLDVFALGLGVPKEQLRSVFKSGHTGFMRLNYYPAHPHGPPAHLSDNYGVHHHTDAGFLTILMQGDVPGLEVWEQGQWHLVEPIAGAFTINVGDMCQVLTNDVFKAPLHRVRASTARNRYSIPFFFSPPFEADIAPLPALVPPGHKGNYNTINWGHFRYKRFEGDVADQGEEIQIVHFRLEA